MYAAVNGFQTPKIDKMPPFTILVVDDFQPLRRFVCSTLEQRAEFRVIGQAADGMEAIQKAVELQPDLILLDLSLPKLNGLAAARQIRQLSPRSKILFLSEHASKEILEEALSMGASGYLVKSDAGQELFAALQAVIEGEQFVSRRLAGRSSPDFKSTRATDSHFSAKSRALTPPQKREITHLHEVQFYSDEAGFFDDFSDFIAPFLISGDSVIVVATESHRNGLFSKLQARGLDISRFVEHGNYIALDVAETLSTFMVNDRPDPLRFSKAVNDVIQRAADAAKGEHIRIGACGECAPVLWAQGKAEAAVRLEQLWDEMAKTYKVDIFCGYPLVDFQGKEGRNMFKRVCAEHTAVYSR